MIEMIITNMSNCNFILVAIVGNSIYMNFPKFDCYYHLFCVAWAWIALMINKKNRYYDLKTVNECQGITNSITSSANKTEEKSECDSASEEN